MTYAAPGSTAQSERSHTAHNGESPVRSGAYSEYVHPFNLVPKVSQPEFDTRFNSLRDQRVKRTNALFALTGMALLETDTVSPTTETWLAIMRQNIRDLDGQVPLFEEERLCVLGLAGMYLSSDTSLRWTEEADVYRHRIERAELVEENARMSTSAYGTTHAYIRRTVAQMADNPNQQSAIGLVTEALHFDPESPEYTFGKAKALLDYASTMVPGTNQQILLLESMAFADEAFANAAGDDQYLRASALHVLARCLHDAAEIPYSFSPFETQDAMLAQQARNLSVALLQKATREFQATDTEHNLIPRVPIDTSLPWSPQVNKRKDYPDARYFLSKYSDEVRDNGIYLPYTPEIKQFVAKHTAAKFGHDILVLAEQQDQYAVAA